MATPLAVGDIILVVYGSRVFYKAQTGITRCYYQVVQPGTETYETLPHTLYDNIKVQMKAWLPSVATFQGCQVTRQPKNNVNILVGTFGPILYQEASPGLSAATTLPLQNSALCRYTSVGLPLSTPPLRPAKGRSFVPFIATDNYDNVNAILNPAGNGKLWSVLSRLGPSVVIGAKGLNLMMVLRRSNPPTPPSKVRPFAGWAEVVKAVALKTIGTQRRRGDFGKINAAFGGPQ